ncbi:MAG: DUF1634 domain-containing protein [Thermomicrobium sp.]|nr:DUF1634 domain-containing protein [Thermomicrobium sp.]MDW7981228.1 DUF1634 domain-containing protein [Thermomicrobium sp.]
MHDERITASPRSTVRVGSASDRLDLLISHVLRLGVSIAALVGAVGLALFFVRGPQPGDPRTVHELLALRAGTQARGPRELLDGLLAARPDDIMRLGVLVLLLTPTARVALSLLLFVLERDVVFALVAAVVLFILLLGLAGLVGG